jgi:protein CMS1
MSRRLGRLQSISTYVKTADRHRIGIGVGTPARIQDLIKAEALKTSYLNRIVIDGSYVDQKKRSIFDMKEIFVPLLEFISHKTLKKRYEDGTLQVLVF